MNKTIVKKEPSSISKKIFVVGGTGMLGRNAIKNFVNKGYQVTSISLPTTKKDEFVDERVEYILKDVNSVTDTEMLRIMKEKDYMLVAIGADERYTPKAPAIDFFREYNVTYVMNLLRMARLAKIKKVVILGSYYTYFNRIWPELKLEKHHPYIRSRVEQMELAFTFNSAVMQVVILEIPYVFGTIPKQTPLWNILENQLNSNNHIYYPLGGTAMMTEKEVSEAIEGAFLYGVGGKAYPLASINLKWKDFLSYLLKLNGQEHKILTPYSNFATSREMAKKMKEFKKNGKESGLDLLEFLNFQKRDAYIDPEYSMNELRFNADDLKEALKKTLIALEQKSS